MAEPTCKRPRDVEEDHNSLRPLDAKRQRPYDDMILSLLEEDEDVPSHDLSAFISSLQHELSSDDAPAMAAPLSAPSSLSSSPKEASIEEEEKEEKEKERVMRQLLEASDDELGLPSREEDGDELEWGEGFGNGAVTGDGVWEIDDEAADYQTVVQPELFM